MHSYLIRFIYSFITQHGRPKTIIACVHCKDRQEGVALLMEQIEAHGYDFSTDLVAEHLHIDELKGETVIGWNEISTIK